MGIDKISLEMAGPSNRLIERVSAGGSGVPISELFRKNFGEPIPKRVDISKDPFLQQLFSQQGVVERIRRKLSVLSRKKGKIIPAKGVVASALNACQESNNEDLVFVGVDFLAEYHPQEATVAGVLAHEWGHLVSEFPNGLNADSMSWEEVFNLRKEEEAMADGFAGKMLLLMGYSPEGLIEFLAKSEKSRRPTVHSLTSPKYYPIGTRAAIIREAYREAKRRQEQARKMVLVPNPAFRNPFTARLIAIA